MIYTCLYFYTILLSLHLFWFQCRIRHSGRGKLNCTALGRRPASVNMRAQNFKNHTLARPKTLLLLWFYGNDHKRVLFASHATCLMSMKDCYFLWTRLLLTLDSACLARVSKAWTTLISFLALTSKYAMSFSLHQDKAASLDTCKTKLEGIRLGDLRLLPNNQCLEHSYWFVYRAVRSCCVSHNHYASNVQDISQSLHLLQGSGVDPQDCHLARKC